MDLFTQLVVVASAIGLVCRSIRKYRRTKNLVFLGDIIAAAYLAAFYFLVAWLNHKGVGSDEIRFAVRTGFLLLIFQVYWHGSRKGNVPMGRQWKH